jgi:enoyl-CoA hydratase
LHVTALTPYDISGGIATVTLNRPQKRNAINYAMADSLMAVLDALESNAAVGAVILTGAGEKAFSAGGDIHEFSQSVRGGPAIAIREFVRRGQAMTARIEAFAKPVIVAVNGLAYGGGCEIVEAAHLAVAADDVAFAKPEIRLGMPPTFGGTQRLPRLAGRKRALECLLTGESFSAQRALELGLINQVVSRAELMPAARSLAQRVLRYSPQAISAILTAVTRGINTSIGEGLHIESEQFARLVPTRDLVAGLEDWKNRRTRVPASKTQGRHPRVMP